MLKLNIISIKNKMKFYFLVFLLVNTAIWGEKPDFSCKDGRCSIHFDEIIDTLYADSSCHFVTFEEIVSKNELSVRLNHYGECRVLLNSKSGYGIEFYSVRSGLLGDFSILYLKKRKFLIADDFFGVTEKRVFYSKSFHIQRVDEGKIYYAYTAGSSFYSEPYIKKWDKEDLNIKCDFIKDEPSDDSCFTGIMTLDEKPCLVNDMIVKNGEIKSFVLNKLKMWNQLDSIKLYSSDLLSEFPVYINKCERNVCFVDVLRPVSSYWSILMPQDVFFCDTNATVDAIPFDYEDLSIESECKYARFERGLSSSVKLIIDREETCKIVFRSNSGENYQTIFRFVKNELGFRALYTKDLIAVSGLKQPEKRVVCFDRRKKNISRLDLITHYFIVFWKKTLEWFSSIFGDFFDLDPLWSKQYLDETNVISRDSVYIVPSKLQDTSDTLFVK